MRKKIIFLSVLIVLVVAAILILTQQPDARFEGERISDQGSYALRFDRMNMTDSETLVLREGDSLCFSHCDMRCTGTGFQKENRIIVH